MTHKFELDFLQNVIKGKGPKIEKNSVTTKCYVFVLKEKQTQFPDSINLLQVKNINKQWLYGPATSLKNKTIMYPCSRFKCSLPCPCLLCQKIHPSCHEPNSKSCNCEDCKSHFSDHTSYHAAFHYGCRSCFQLSNIFPCFNFFFLNKMNKETPAHATFDMPEDKLSAVFLNEWLVILNKYKKGIDDNNMWCKYCHVLYWSFDDLRHHMQTKHNISKMFEHIYYNVVKVPQSEYKCHQCNKQFGSSKDLNRHIDAIHLKEYYECENCDAKFSRKDNLRRHMSNKHVPTDENKKISCADCGKQFTRVDSLQIHKDVVHESTVNKQITCELCGQIFNLKKNLQRHQQSSMKDGVHKFNCDKCNGNFCTRTMLINHRETKHGQEPGIFKCYRCSTNFRLYADLQNHKQSVHFSEAYKCKECDKSFERYDNLKRHKATHNDNDNLKSDFKCELCNTSFVWRTSYQKHIKEFYKKDGFHRNVCYKCGEDFCTGKLLTAHINSQHGFNCERCGQQFSNRDHLNLHVKKRTNLSCNHCDTQFCNLRSLNSHIKKYHDSN